MSHARSILFKVITRTTFVIGLALAIIFIPNLSIFDEKLLPEITERLSNPPNPNINGNAIYPLYGISAATGKDPDAVGKSVIQSLQSKHAKGEFANLTQDERTTLYGGDEKWDAEWQTAYPAADCTPRKQTNCFSELMTDVKQTPLIHPRLITQLERYRRIIQLPHLIEETRLMDYTSPLPNYSLLMQLGKLSQTSAYQTQGLDGLLANSEEDMRFWRMALADSHTTLGRMVAIASLYRNVAALSHAIKQESALSSTQLQHLQALLKPLTIQEVNLEKVLVSELRFGAENWQTAPKAIPEGESIILWTLTQPVAATNWFYRQTLKPAFALNQMSSVEFYEHAQTPTTALIFSRFNPYNLGGKINLAKNWQYAPYIGRAHDLAGIYSLVALQLELKTIAKQDWPAAIKSSHHKNPYTKKPFDYDAATNSLGFSCFSAADICQIQL
ncbi:hypothetical protein [Cellvibrio fibrivorans]|uniref:DUF885 domain-containing protein n=1 Tax=Cellvibrio fibrivorans TaxID=126350 RepID=A0ABU1V0Y2_9GAMM|nr:hypothetical protein [Cellvibrio fibrivorans]MDR7091113.1 hypothetical protein [Cellvibrio fibrivorans]